MQPTEPSGTKPWRAFLVRKKQQADQRWRIFRASRIYSKADGLTHRFVRYWILVGKSFVHNRCLVRASALAYTTLLALIPLLAVAVSVSSSLLRGTEPEKIEQVINSTISSVAPQLGLMEELIQEDLHPEALGPGEPLTEPISESTTGDEMERSPGTDEKTKGGEAQAQPAGSRQVAEKISEYINNIRSGTLGATSMLVLVVVAISLLRTIEATFNDIWGVSHGRSWLSSIVLYWAAITLGPLLLSAAITLQAGDRVEKLQNFFQSGSLQHLGNLFHHYLPVAVMILTFALLYQLMPNTRVEWRASAVGGLVGGILFHLNSLCSRLYFGQVVDYTSIYGGLSVIPLFLLGLYISWVILLFGAQVAYAYQNRDAYQEEEEPETINQDGVELLALRLMAVIGDRFESGTPAPATSELVAEVGVPSRLVAQNLELLKKAGLIIEATGPCPTFALACPSESIHASDILRATRSQRGRELRFREAPSPGIRDSWQSLRDQESSIAGSISLSELVQASASVTGTTASKT